MTGRVSIEDCIELTRIEAVADLSADGSRFAAVGWRGDLGTDENVWSILVGETTMGRPEPSVVATVRTREEWEPQAEPHGAPILDVRFLGGARDAVTFVASLDGGPKQVHRLDIDTGVTTALTEHPTSVQTYSTSADGSTIVYTAPDPGAVEQWATWRREGFLLHDTPVQPPRMMRVMYGLTPAPSQAWLRTPTDTAPRLLDAGTGCRQLGDLPPAGILARRPHFYHDWIAACTTWSVSPDGSHAVFWPYVGDAPFELSQFAFYHDDTDGPGAWRIAAPYGLLHLATGRREELLAAPHDAVVANADTLAWSPDGGSVLVSSFLPAESAADPVSGRPEVVEVDLATRATVRLGLGEEWTVQRWTPHGAVVRSGATIRQPARVRLARTLRTLAGWTAPEPLQLPPDLHSDALATNGRLVVGVLSGTSTPPEIAVWDLADAATARRTTTLNPRLARRALASVERIHWSSEYDDDLFGWLFQPDGYSPGTRRPLAVLLKKGSAERDDNTFVVDGGVQLGGFAIQTLAAHGVMVLFAPSPPSTRAALDTADEVEPVRAQVESAVAHLSALGVVDPDRVAVSGWSRAAYRVNKLLVTSDFPFAAAALVDGGGREYVDPEHGDGRLWRRSELAAISTPLLVQVHGPEHLQFCGEMFDVMDNLGLPVEMHYLPTARHNPTLPSNRLRSLSVHTEWLRFWLQDHETGDPAHARRYERWRALRAAVRRQGTVPVPRTTGRSEP